MGKFDHLDTLLSKFIRSGPAGCACAVAQDGKILYEGYHGFADLDKQQLITPDTVYRLYSMTKVIVCTAALKLFEQGHYLLHEPLYEYIPEFKDAHVYHHDADGEPIAMPAKRPVLIRDAFTMSVGLPNPHWSDTPTGITLNRAYDQLYAQHNGRFDLQTAIRGVAHVPMAFEPGEHWMYGLGHDIVAALVEVISGKTIGQFLQDEIFAPLGMKDTGYRYRDDIADRMATCYNIGPTGERVPVQGVFDAFHAPDATYEGGGSGLYATLRDYLTFSQMLACGGEYAGERILGRKTIDLMRTNFLDDTRLAEFRSGPYYTGYGYGLGVRTLMDRAAANANASLGEFGWSGLAGTWTSIDPAERLSIVYMHQTFPHMEVYHHLRVRAAVYGAL